MKKKVLNAIYIIVLVILILITGGLIFERVGFFRFVVIGNSMSGTLEEGQLGAAVKKEFIHEIHRGDIVIFYRETNRDYEVVKRVIGVPYDKIELKQNELYINGEIFEETYLKNGNEKELTNHGNNAFYSVTLSENEYYVMGDNRRVSYDSRYYGAIKKDCIVGKLKLIYANSTCVNSCEEMKDKKSIPWIFY